MLHQIFNDFILSALLLHQGRHRSVTVATAELSNFSLSLFAECPNDVTLTSVGHHSDDRSMTSSVGVWNRV